VYGWRVCWRLNVGVFAGVALALLTAQVADGQQAGSSGRALRRSVAAVQRRADRLERHVTRVDGHVTQVEGRLARLERETATIRDRVARVEAKVPNQTRTFVVGLISGFAVAVLGHFVKWLIDATRERGDRRRRERALVAACAAELAHAHETVERNRETIERDLEELKNDNEAITPVTRLDLSNIARMIEAPPRRLTKDGELLKAITVLRVDAEYANDLGTTRDAYKSLTDTDVEALRIVGELLQAQLTKVIGHIDEVSPKVTPLAI
jgi:hypothetical protein